MARLVSSSRVRASAAPKVVLLSPTVHRLAVLVGHAGRRKTAVGGVVVVQCQCQHLQVVAANQSSRHGINHGPYNQQGSGCADRHTGNTFKCIRPRSARKNRTPEDRDDDCGDKSNRAEAQPVAAVRNRWVPSGSASEVLSSGAASRNLKLNPASIAAHDSESRATLRHLARTISWTSMVPLLTSTNPWPPRRPTWPNPVAVHRNTWKSPSAAPFR